MRLIRLLKRDLARETRSWVEDGVIDQSQGEAICGRYGIDYHHPDQSSFGHAVLVVLGYLFIGLSLLTLIGANWDEIPRWLRTAGLVLLVLVVNLRGWFNFRAGNQSAATGWFFLGALFYGSAIMLIAQIYHLGEHFPDGILWWALGVLPIALLTGSGLLTLLMLALAYVWFYVESGLDFFPAAFPLFLIASGWYLWRQGTGGLIFMATVAGVGLFAEYGLSWLLEPGSGFDFGAENVVLSVGLFLVLQGFAQWLMSRPSPQAGDYGVLLQAWVLRFFLFTLLVFSFAEPWEEMLEPVGWAMPEAAIALAVACSVAAMLLTRLAKADCWSVRLAVLLYLGLLAALFVLANKRYGLHLQVVDNLILIGFGVWLIVRGIQEQVSHWFYLGLSAILLTGLLRYIDLVGDYVGAAILFAVFAAILLGVARVWRGRIAST